MSLLNNFTLANGETSYYALAGSGIPIPGPPGPTGPQGPIGPTGPSGNSILSDVVPPAAGLGQTNDLYVDLVTSQLYKKTDPITWTPEFAMIGPAGVAATVAVGVTTTGAPGSMAAVNNTGTPQAAVLNFAIPAGAQGPTGPQGPPGPAASAAVWSQYPATQAVDMASNVLSNASGIAAPVGLTVAAATGDIELTLSDPSGNGKVLLQGGPLDMDGNDLNNLGSVTTAGLAETIDLGSVLSAPVARFTVLSSEVGITHLDPLTQMTIRGQGDVRVESTNGDLNLIGDDVNIATTGATNVLNITSLGVMQNTAGGAINNSAGGAFAVQAGGLISILTTGSIQIGSGNVLGATTSVEKLDINDSVVSKVSGASDLQFQNTTLIQNSGNPLNTLTLEATDATTTLRGEGVIIETTGVPAGGSGNIQIKTPAWAGATIDISAGTGITTFLNVAPQCPVAPAVPTDLTNKAYVDKAYGSFGSDQTQIVAGAGLETDISFNLTFQSVGVSIDPLNPTRMVVAEAGVYKFSYSAQLDKSGGGVSLCDLWIKINGTSVPNSASRCVVAGTNGETFPYCEYILTLSASQYVEVAFTSADTTMAVTYFPAAPPIPAVPSIICNFIQIA
jgi:hypothetical protein